MSSKSFWLKFFRIVLIGIYIGIAILMFGGTHSFIQVIEILISILFHIGFVAFFALPLFALSGAIDKEKYGYNWFLDPISSFFSSKNRK